MPKFTVAVITYEDGEVIDTIGSSTTKRGLERTQRGVDTNLNHQEYYTEIREVDEEDKLEEEG